MHNVKFVKVSRTYPGYIYKYVDKQRDLSLHLFSGMHFETGELSLLQCFEYVAVVIRSCTWPPRIACIPWER